MAGERDTDILVELNCRDKSVCEARMIAKWRAELNRDIARCKEEVICQCGKENVKKNEQERRGVVNKKGLVECTERKTLYSFVLLRRDIFCVTYYFLCAVK